MSEAKETKKGPPDPRYQPVEYLRWHGWELESGNEEDGTALWLPPDARREETTTRERIGTRMLSDGTFEPIYQLVVTPPTWPCSLRLAIQQQRKRDAEKTTADQR